MGCGIRTTGVTVDGGAGGLFRFSGFDPHQPRRMTMYNERLAHDDSAGAAALLLRCSEALRAEGLAEAEQWPYAFAAFHNGVSIPEVALWPPELPDSASNRPPLFELPMPNRTRPPPMSRASVR